MTSALVAMAWGSVAVAAAPTHAPALPCGTPIEAFERVEWARPGPPARQRLTSDDPYGTWPHERASTHFVVRWGDDGALIAEGLIDHLLSALEEGHALFIDELGHTPIASPDAPFQVYIGDSWEQGPPSYGNAGYFYAAPDGSPMLVIGDFLLATPDDVTLTAVHELYHAVQSAAGGYTYTGTAAWYFEATATWAPTLLYPEMPNTAAFLHAYALSPELSLHHFDYPDTGSLEELYQYGAFLFPLHLSGTHGAELIRDSWELAGDQPDPLEVLTELLTPHDGVLPEIWMDHAARTVAWDYPQGKMYEGIVAAWAAALPGDDHRIVGTIPTIGIVDGRPDPALRPRRFGVNVWELPTASHPVDLRIVGAPTGTEGSPTQIAGRLVRRTLQGEASYQTLTFEELEARHTLAPLELDETLYVVIGTWSEASRGFEAPTEQFSYAIFAEPVIPETEEPEAPKGCGCTSSASSPSWLWILCSLGLWRRRRPCPLLESDVATVRIG